jgi:hypothetical protein
LLIARQRNFSRVLEMVPLSQTISSTCLASQRQTKNLGVNANLFNNPIDAFTPPYSLPAIPVFLFILMDIFIPYRTACDTIVPGCSGIQHSTEGRFHRVRGCQGLLGWGMFEYSATKNVLAFDFSGRLEEPCRITAVHL